MDNVKILEVKQSIFASNDEQAAQLRQSLKEKKIFLLNLMSAPAKSAAKPISQTLTMERFHSSFFPCSRSQPAAASSTASPSQTAVRLPLPFEVRLFFKDTKLLCFRSNSY